MSSVERVGNTTIRADVNDSPDCTNDNTSAGSRNALSKRCENVITNLVASAREHTSCIPSGNGCGIVMWVGAGNASQLVLYRVPPAKYDVERRQQTVSKLFGVFEAACGDSEVADNTCFTRVFDDAQRHRQIDLFEFGAGARLRLPGPACVLVKLGMHTPNTSAESMYVCAPGYCWTIGVEDKDKRECCDVCHCYFMSPICWGQVFN